MALTDYVIMPGTDYQAICDAIRAKTGKTDVIKSGDAATEIESINVGGDFSDENLKYFTYQIDGEANTITLFTILYDVIYANTGSYDVTIPDTIAGFNVVIKSE